MLDNQKSREIAANIVDPIAKGLLRIGLTANSVTVIGASLSAVIALYTIPKGNFGLALALLIPLVAADLLDGTMARLSNSVSKKGAFLDSVMDRVTDMALLGAFVLWSISTEEINLTYLLLLAIGESAVIPYIRAKAESIDIECKVGLLERGERILLIGIATILAALNFQNLVIWVFAIFTILGLITIVQRISIVLKSVE
jgi:CDP-diacylglycerol--glycerol-3-phosphate 3-phosphatidyltransferase